MTLVELKKLIAQGESERLEFKRTTGQIVEAARTVCAMLNGLGGFVLIGVNDKGKVTGQQVSSKTLADVANELRKIEPPAFPDTETVSVDSLHSVVVLRVQGGAGPYTYDGRPYVRAGSTTRRMPQQHYERLLLERMHATRRWENQLAERITYDDLDGDEILRTVDEAIRRQRMADPGTRRIEELLTGFGLTEKGALLNAAVVLFGKPERMLPTYPQCAIRLARFRGVDKTEFLDNRQELGNAFELLKLAQRFFVEHLPVAGRVLPNVFERVDDPLYPPAALREALANALCHRDYSVPGGAVSVAIFDDRLKISSTGPLPFDLKPEDLVRQHPSRPWNPLVAHVFYRRGIIETWGRGTLRIRELTAAAGLPAPEFECSGGEVLVRFRSAPTPLPRQLSDQVTVQVSDQVADQVLTFCQQPRKAAEIRSLIHVRHPPTFRKNYLRPLLGKGLLAMTISDKPNSRLQRYKTTQAGLLWLAAKARR